MFNFLLNFYYYFFKKHAELALPLPKPEPSQFLINLAKIKNKVEDPNLSDVEKHYLDVLMNEVIPEAFEKAYVSKTNYFHISRANLMAHKSANINSSGADFYKSWDKIKLEAFRRLTKDGIQFSNREEFITFEASQLIERTKNITIPPEKEEEMVVNSIGIYR